MRSEKYVDHPDIEKLADYSAGLLEESEAESIEKHLECCTPCRLEVKRIERFNTIDSDAALAQEAGWSQARFRLERALRENILPEFMGHEPAEAQKYRPPFGSKWLAPLTAAAAVILIFIYVEKARFPMVPSTDLGPMRGDSEVEYGVSLQSPVGEVAACPEQFQWYSDRKNDYYTLQIFTTDLSKVYTVDNIADTLWVVPDSLKAILHHEKIYLWSVKGHKGLERVLESPNGWFKINPELSSK